MRDNKVYAANLKRLFSAAIDDLNAPPDEIAEAKPYADWVLARDDAFFAEIALTGLGEAADKEWLLGYLFEKAEKAV